MPRTRGFTTSQMAPLPRQGGSFTTWLLTTSLWGGYCPTCRCQYCHVCTRRVGLGRHLKSIHFSKCVFKNSEPFFLCRRVVPTALKQRKSADRSHPVEPRRALFKMAGFPYVKLNRDLGTDKHYPIELKFCTACFHSMAPPEGARPRIWKLRGKSETV